MVYVGIGPAEIGTLSQTNLHTEFGPTSKRRNIDAMARVKLIAKQVGYAQLPCQRLQGGI